MSYSHLFYTSSQVGIFRSLGYQIFNVSENVTEEERDYIVRYGAYKLPTHLEQLRDLEEIVEHSPKILSTNVLPSGRLAMTHGVYVGLDYSGRRGNYFTHTVIFQHDKPMHYPLEYLGSSCFKQELTQEEKSMTSVDNHWPTTTDFEIGNVISLESVRQFLQHKGRMSTLEKMVDAVINYDVSRKKIVIIDERTNIPFWIAAIHYCFPIKQAWDLTFTTCVDNPNNASAVICGVEREAYENSNWKSYFQTFNVLTGELPTIIAGTYARLAVVQLAAGETLHTFFELNGVSQITTHLNEVSPLSHLLADDVRPFLTKDGFSNFLTYYLGKRQSKLYAELTERFAEMALTHEELRTQMLDVSITQANELADSLFNLANENSSARQLAMEFVYQYANHLLQRATSTYHIEPYKKFLKVLWEKYSHVTSFVQFGYSSARIEKLRDMIESLTELQWEAMFGTIIDNLLAGEEDYDSTLIETYFTHLIDRGLDKSFSFMNVLPEMIEDESIERLSIGHYIELCVTPNALFVDQQQQLKKMILQLKQLVSSNSAYRWKYEEYVRRYPQLEQILQEHLWEQIAEQPLPITFVVEQCIKVLPIVHDQERFLVKAMETSVQKRQNVLSELQKLMTVSFWHSLPEQTMCDFIRLALSQLTSTSGAKDYNSMLKSLQEEFIVPRARGKNTEIERLQQEVEGLILLDRLKWEQLFKLEHFNSLLQLHLLLPEHVERFVEKKTHKFIDSSKENPAYLRSVIEFLLPAYREEVFSYFSLLRTPASMTNVLAVYIETLLTKELALTEQELQFVNKSKSLKKLAEEMQPHLFNKLKEQAKKSKSGLWEKILRIVRFKKGKRNE